MAPAAHNATVVTKLAVRLLVALACVAGVVVSVISRDSRAEMESAFFRYFDTGNRADAIRHFRHAKRLNPAFALDIGLARLQPEKGVAILSDAVRREPENAELWLRLAQQQAHAGDRAGAKGSYARARRLAPAFLPPDGPPPGL
jgi:predicted Zn-dependent protease